MIRFHCNKLVGKVSVFIRQKTPYTAFWAVTCYQDLIDVEIFSYDYRWTCSKIYIYHYNHIANIYVRFKVKFKLSSTLVVVKQHRSRLSYSSNPKESDDGRSSYVRNGPSYRCNNYRQKQEMAWPKKLRISSRRRTKVRQRRHSSTSSCRLPWHSFKASLVDEQLSLVVWHSFFK